MLILQIGRNAANGILVANITIVIFFYSIVANIIFIACLKSLKRINNIMFIATSFICGLDLVLIILLLYRNLSSGRKSINLKISDNMEFYLAILSIFLCFILSTCLLIIKLKKNINYKS